jgi:hypothetical protein
MQKEMYQIHTTHLYVNIELTCFEKRNLGYDTGVCRARSFLKS